MANSTDQTVDFPSVLLTGASSQIGVFAIPRLLNAGFRVLAISRRERPAWCPPQQQLEWLNEADAIKAAHGCKYLLAAGPLALTQKLLETSLQFQSVVGFSSSSVETKLESGDSAEQSQMQAMLGLESQLRGRAEGVGTKLVILRPTMIYGCGLDANISRLASWIRRFGFMPINGAAKGLRQPVHADDLASVAVDALLSKDVLPPVLSVSGGEILAYSDMITRIFMALEKPVRLVRLPQWLFVMLAAIANAFRFGGNINGEMVRRQSVDLVFDDSEARALLNYKPRAFTPVKKDFSLPELQK